MELDGHGVSIGVQLFHLTIIKKITFATKHLYEIRQPSQDPIQISSQATTLRRVRKRIDKILKSG